MTRAVALPRTSHWPVLEHEQLHRCACCRCASLTSFSSQVLTDAEAEPFVKELDKLQIRLELESLERFVRVRGRTTVRSIRRKVRVLRPGLDQRLFGCVCLGAVALGLMLLVPVLNLVINAPYNAEPPVEPVLHAPIPGIAYNIAELQARTWNRYRSQPLLNLPRLEP